MEQTERQTKNEAKKEYLKEYEHAVRRARRYAEKVTEIRLNKICPSLPINGTPHAANQSDLSSYAAALEKAEKLFAAAQIAKYKKCEEISEEIEKMENENEKDVLINRYIRLMKWEDIANKMGYSWQHIHKIHAKALKNFKLPDNREGAKEDSR